MALSVTHRNPESSGTLMSHSSGQTLRSTPSPCVSPYCGPWAVGDFPTELKYFSPLETPPNLDLTDQDLVEQLGPRSPFHHC